MNTISKLKQVFGEPDRVVTCSNGTSLIWRSKKETIIVMIYNEVER